MKKTGLILGALALSLVGLFALSGQVEAYRGDPNTRGQNYSVERHEAMEQAFESNDYNAWKELMSGKGRVTQVVTEENFTRFVEAHELAEDGKLDEARQIRQELGLGLHNGSDQGQRGSGMGRCNK